VMCTVIVEGIEDGKRNTWKTPIAKIRTEPQSSGATTDGEDVTIKRQEHVKLMKEITELTTKMETLQLKMERLGW